MAGHTGQASSASPTLPTGMFSNGAHHRGLGRLQRQESVQRPSPAQSMAAPPLLLLLLGALLVPCATGLPSHNTSDAPTVQVTVGVLLPERNLGYPWAWPRVAPALSLALEALQPQLSLDGIFVRTFLASTENEEGRCDHRVALFKAAELKSSHNPDVLLGLGCYDSSVLVGPFAHYWQLPLLKAGFYQRHKDSPMEKTVYTGPMEPHLHAFQARLHQHFNWTPCPVVISSKFPSRQHFLYSYNELLELTTSFTPNIHKYGQPGEAVRYIQGKGRVAYIFGSLEMLRDLMRLAQAQNMTNGDYIFFYMDVLGKSLRAEGHREAAKPWQSKESNDTGGLRKAFQTVLVITSHEPQTPEYRRFQNQLVLRAQRDFGVAINDSLGHLVAGCFHDGLLLYLRALNETLREGGTKRDTSRILENMRSLKVQGVTGTVNINRKNDRETDFDLWAMRDVESGEYQVVGHYTASEDRINWMGPIHWKAGRPPLDNPLCAFDKENPCCDANENLVNLGSAFF